jgi:hypothetical protein
LLGRHSTTWAIPPILFAMAILEIGSHFFCLAWSRSQSFYFRLSTLTWMTGMPHHVQLFFCWNGVLQTFCPDWPGTMGMSLCAWVGNEFLIKRILLMLWIWRVSKIAFKVSLKCFKIVYILFLSLSIKTSILFHQNVVSHSSVARLMAK